MLGFGFWLSPRQSWLGCWGVCVCVRAAPVPRQSRLGFVVRVSRFGLWLSTRQSWQGCWGVCVCVCAPLAPRQSWLGCAVWVCVLGFWFRVLPATLGWGLGCVCLCARSACTPPILAGVCGVGVSVQVVAFTPPILAGVLGRVCLCARSACTPPVLAGVCSVGVCLGSGFGCAPPFLAGVLGCVCVGVRPPPSPRHSWPGFVVCGLGVAWHLLPCSGSLRVLRASRVGGTWSPLLLGTCRCAVVVAGGVPLWRASWPRVVCRASSGPVALGAPAGFPVAVVPSPTPGAFAPGFTGRLRGARGGRPRTGLMVPATCPCRGRGAGLAPRRTRSGLRDGVGPGGSLRRRSRAACAAVIWRVWTWSLTLPVSRTVRLLAGASAGAPGLFHVDADTSPFGSEDATPGSRACVRVRALLGRVGRAGLPGAFWCA